MRDFSSELQPWCRQGMRLVPAQGATRSYLGGDPRLEPAAKWPTNGDRPLKFVARISLAEANASSQLQLEGDAGALLFFYDEEALPGGWDPKDSTAFAVLSVPDLDEPVESSASARAVRFLPTATFPSWEHPAVKALKLSDAESDDYEAFIDNIFGDAPRHQFGGHPSPIQGEGMELLCQLASSGHYCGGDWSHLADVLPQMRESAGRWRMLLQIDSDEGLRFEWGDGGALFFWAPVNASGALLVADAWVVMQCL